LAASPSLQKLSKSHPFGTAGHRRLSSRQSRLYSAASVQSRDTNPAPRKFCMRAVCGRASCPPTDPSQHNVQWVCLLAVSTLWPRCGHVRDRSARVRGPMRPTVRPQSTPCRWRFTLSQTRTISAKRAEVHQNLSRTPSPHGTATRRWPVKCRRGHHGVQTRGARAADHGIRR